MVDFVILLKSHGFPFSPSHFCDGEKVAEGRMRGSHESELAAAHPPPSFGAYARGTHLLPMM